MVGKAFPLLRSSAAHNLKSLFPSPRILPQLRLRHLWDLQAQGNSLSHLLCLRPPQIFLRGGVQGLRPPHLRRPASPPCPTSRSLIVSTMSRSLSPKQPRSMSRPSDPKQPRSMGRPSNPTQSRPMIRSTSTTGAWKYCAARPSFASTPARCHSTLPCSARRFHWGISPLLSLPMGARALYPPTQQPISRLS